MQRIILLFLAMLFSEVSAWAQHAPVLILSLARTQFARGGKDNRHAWYDVGQATAGLCLQATAMGLYVHQMAGFSADKARATFAVPAGYEPVACMAVGYLGEAATADPAFAARDGAPRARSGIDVFVYGATWGEFPDSLRD